MCGPGCESTLPPCFRDKDFFYLEGYDLHVHCCKEAKGSVRPRDDIEEVRVLIVLGANLDGAVRGDDLVPGADVLPKTILVGSGLDSTSHHQASNSQVA